MVQVIVISWNKAKGSIARVEAIAQAKEMILLLDIIYFKKKNLMERKN